MDIRKKKMAMDELMIQCQKSQDIVMDIINQLDDEDFDNDFKLTVAAERLGLMFSNLLDLINEV